ncbi:MAG: SPOR domain-containing protein, partial [Nitrospinales bacterium]
PSQQKSQQAIQAQVMPVSLNRETQAPRPLATPAVMAKKVAPAKTKKSTLKAVPPPKTKTVLSSKSVSVLNVANPGKPGEVYIVQAGAFSIKRNAELLTRKLKTKGLNAAIQTQPSQKLMNVVFVGAFENEKASRESFQALKDAGFNPKLKKNGNGVYTFILGKFKTKSRAETLQDDLSVKGFLSSMKQSNVDTTNYVVQLGRFRTEDEARLTQKKMAELGFKKTFIKKTG